MAIMALGLAKAWTAGSLPQLVEEDVSTVRGVEVKLCECLFVNT